MTRLEELTDIKGVSDFIVDLSNQQIEALKGHEGKEIPADALPAFVNRDAELKAAREKYDRLLQVKTFGADASALLTEMKKPGESITFPGGKPDSEGKGHGAPPAGPSHKTIGQQFQEHPEFKEWYGKAVPPGGVLTDVKKLPGASPAIGFKTLLTGATDTQAGAFIFNDVQQYSQLLTLPRRPLMMRDIITNGSTTSDTVEYVRQTSETNNAAPVAEATATSGASGAKPESAIAFEKVTATVKTIAHWIPATTRALSDAGQLRTLIDAFLRAGLEQELEDQMVTGDGTGENFTGLETISGVLTQAFATDLLTTTRRARTNLRVNGRVQPSAYLFHPNDWEDIDLLQDNEARYFYGGPAAMGTPRLWGVPVIESEAVTEGTAWLGDFKYLVLWDREQASIQVSNSHSDFFIRNMVAILAEMRAAFGCLRATAFVEIDLTA